MRTTSILHLILNSVLGTIETLLGLRIILKLLGANPIAPFVQWEYQTSAPFIVPFKEIFPSPGSQGYVIEMSVIFALIAYALLGFLLMTLFNDLSDYYEKRDQIRYREPAGTGSAPQQEANVVQRGTAHQYDYRQPGGIYSSEQFWRELTG